MKTQEYDVEKLCVGKNSTKSVDLITIKNKKRREHLPWTMETQEYDVEKPLVGKNSTKTINCTHLGIPNGFNSKDHNLQVM